MKIKNNDKNKKNYLLNLLNLVFIFLILLFLWAGLTKAGYINNFLDIEILCSKQQDVQILDWHDDPKNRDQMEYKPIIYLYPPNTKQTSRLI